ncbi:MAG: thioredoxin domain-containing protein [bacterium]|nr:thioredoxin domain-containing protein [bacterium]
MSPTPQRPVAEIRRDGNRLRHEPSLYLRQHAHNPVDWWPWGPEALGEAAARACPIFLSIGYSSCHWCHVMEGEAFDDDDIATFLNRHFVCIKVDREERPDLDAVYMDAVQALTGHGGWPMSSFLTPEGRPFHGGTYFPAAHFRHLIEQVAALWRERPADLRAQADRVAAHVAELPDWARQPAGPLDPAWLEAAAHHALDIADHEHGGFRQRQKFPTPVKWRFLVSRCRDGDAELGPLVASTLAAIAGGGLRDHLGGGFFRYTVDAAWTVPHFEKMLYDNAQLASLFLEAGRTLDSVAYTEVARDTLAFLVREMRDPDGGLYASFDADSGGHEGSYYLWTPDEVLQVAGAADGPALCALLGITPEGNFEDSGSSVPSRRGSLETGDGRPPAWADPDAAGGAFARQRAVLLAERARRTPPGLDRKVVTAWNGLAIAALARGGVDCGEPAFIAAADAAADFVLGHHRRTDGSLGRSSSAGQAAGDGILDDYACLADGLLELFLATGQARRLAEARALVATALARFAHPDGGWYLVPDDAEAPLGRPLELFDNVEPSGNATLLRVLARLGALTGETAYLREAERVLAARGGLLVRAGLDVAGWLGAAQLLLSPPAVVVVAGRAGDPRAAALLEAARAPGPDTVLAVLVPADGADRALAAAAPALAGKRTADDGPLAYVCRGMTCAAPVADAAALRALLEP